MIVDFINRTGEGTGRRLAAGGWRLAAGGGRRKVNGRGMSDIIERLRDSRPVLWDGALGTQVPAPGLPRGQPAERLVLERPELVAGVHRSYVEAGAEGIETTSFGANRLRLARFGLASRMGEINR